MPYGQNYTTEAIARRESPARVAARLFGRAPRKPMVRNPRLSAFAPAEDFFEREFRLVQCLRVACRAIGATIHTSPIRGTWGTSYEVRLRGRCMLAETAGLAELVECVERSGRPA